MIVIFFVDAGEAKTMYKKVTGRKTSTCASIFASTFTSKVHSSDTQY